MGLSISYLNGAMAATVAKWTPHTLKQVRDAPPEFVEDVCDAPGDNDLDYVRERRERHERLTKLEERIAKNAIKMKESHHFYQEFETEMQECIEFCAMIDKHGPNWGPVRRFLEYRQE